MMKEYKWWQSAVFYQIYPRSFADGNGDGIGDFVGMTQKLDYLQSLGVDAVWISPHYPSPQCDCGYDVSDYCDVAPEYGTLDDFRTFLEEAHQRGIKVVLDLVLNHTSDQHAWFLESRSSLDNPKRDWYIWRKGQDGQPPNNWYSTFGGSAWELDPQTNEYYYHMFFKGQPDLNWRNPEVKQAMVNGMRFWLDLGVDGFRLDAVGTIFEAEDLPNSQCDYTLDDLYIRQTKAIEDPGEKFDGGKLWLELFKYQVEQPGIHELMCELRQVVDEYPDRVLIGETEGVDYYGNGDNELQLVFNFPLMATHQLTADWVRSNQKERLSSLPRGAWPCNTLGNHDKTRVFTHFGDGRHNHSIARANLAVLLTLPGTPFLYNGEEIGMTDFMLESPGQFRDSYSPFIYQKDQELMGSSPEIALKRAANAGRDRCRTPMQWENAANGGFSPAEVQTWLPVNPNYQEGINVAEQELDSDSLLNYYRHLLSTRRMSPALVFGGYRTLFSKDPDCLIFLRYYQEQTCLVVINLSSQRRTLDLVAACGHSEGKVIFGSHTRPDRLALDDLFVSPYEVLIFNL
jgi:alpha-glucosidase